MIDQQRAGRILHFFYPQGPLPDLHPSANRQALAERLELELMAQARSVHYMPRLPVAMVRAPNRVLDVIGHDWSAGPTSRYDMVRASIKERFKQEYESG